MRLISCAACSRRAPASSRRPLHSACAWAISSRRGDWASVWAATRSSTSATAASISCTSSADRIQSASSFAKTLRARSISAMSADASLAPRTHSNFWRRRSCITRYVSMLLSSSVRLLLASSRFACTRVNSSSSCLTPASNSATSGSNVRISASMDMTSRSASCNVNKRLRSDCTTPPCSDCVPTSRLQGRQLANQYLYLVDDSQFFIFRSYR